MADPIPSHHPGCMVCGPDNAREFGVRYEVRGDRVHGSVTAGPGIDGPPGLVHGGAIAAMLDDVMSMVLMTRRVLAVSSELRVSFKGPALLGSRIDLEAWEEGADGKRHRLLAQVHADGSLVATAEQVMVEVEPGFLGGVDWLYER